MPPRLHPFSQSLTFKRIGSTTRDAFLDVVGVVGPQGPSPPFLNNYFKFLKRLSLTASGPRLFCSSIRGRPCHDQMSKRSPSADDDDRDRFQATKSRKRSSNKGGGGCSIQSKENWSLLPFVQAPSWSPHSAAGRHTQLAFPVCPPSMMLTLFLYCISSFPHSTTRQCHFPEAARTPDDGGTAGS